MNKDMKDFLIKRGADSLFQLGHYTSDRSDIAVAARTTIYNNPHLIERFYEDIELHAKTAILDHLAKNDSDIYNLSSYWSNTIDELSNLTLLSVEGTSKLTHMNRNTDSIYLSAACLNPKFDWKPLFFEEMGRAERTGYVSRISNRILTGVMAQDNNLVPLYVRSALFDKTAQKSFGYKIRGFLYRRYIETGLLTSKEARRIRSEASEDASKTGLEALIKNKDLYKGRYENLLLKFSDSKHEWVQITLAQSLPIHLLTSIMGISNHNTRAIIDRRMQAYEDETNSESSKGASDE
jgi:uncharacterized membrane protein